VALTGAGVSTESGIPDFRSAGGIWAQYDPQEVASIEGFRRDPQRVWEFYARRLDVLGNAEPNAAHTALAQLERARLLDGVVTQNVDGLHQRAGSENVIEVHGSIRSASCSSCRRRVGAQGLTALRPLPRCAACGAVLKPDVVMFGELLPQTVFAQASALVRRAGLLLVVGSSLEVWPVAGLPREVLARGGTLAIVNRDPTPYDDDAAVGIRSSAAAVLREAARLALAA